MPNELLHLLELCGGGLNIIITEDHTADGGSANVVGDVDADALLFQAREVLPERLPVGLDAEEVELFLARTANRVV